MAGRNVATSAIGATEHHEPPIVVYGDEYWDRVGDRRAKEKLVEEQNAVPDLYELAFMPGQFRCPQCQFQLSKQTISVVHNAIGTTPENRQSEPCPNDGTMMVHVTYKEQVTAYADRLKEEFDRYDALLARLKDAKNHLIMDRTTGSGDYSDAEEYAEKIFGEGRSRGRWQTG